MSPKLAIVIGANKGIGFKIVRGLCEGFDGDVHLTSRDVERGKEAVHQLQQEGLSPKYHQLDVTDKHSLQVFHDYIKDNYDGINVLVNNVSIFNNEDPTQTIAVNYYAMLAACDTLFPLLKKGARVINLSTLGHLSHIPDASLRNKFKDPSLTVPELSAMMEEYLDAVKNGTQGSKWGNSAYNVSKVAVTALWKIQQSQLDERGIVLQVSSECESLPPESTSKETFSDENAKHTDNVEAQQAQQSLLYELTHEQLELVRLQKELVQAEIIEKKKKWAFEENERNKEAEFKEKERRWKEIEYKLKLGDILKK